MLIQFGYEKKYWNHHQNKAVNQLRRAMKLMHTNIRWLRRGGRRGGTERCQKGLKDPEERGSLYRMMASHDSFSQG